MKSGHLELERLFRRGVPVPSPEVSQHLDSCAACRRQFQLRSQAERALAGDLDHPSPGLADAMLDRALDLAEGVPPKRTPLVRLPLLALALAAPAAAALVFALPGLLAPAEGEEVVDGFQAKGGWLERSVGVRAFCFEAGTVRALEAGGPCPGGGKVGVSVFVRPATPSRAFVFLEDIEGHLLRARREEAGDPELGFAVGAAGQDTVLSAYLDLAAATPGAAQVVVALCDDCTAPEVERLLRSASTPTIDADGPAPDPATILQGDDTEVRVERVPIQVTGETP